MGEVYVAIQEPLGRRVALKLIKSLLTHPAATQRFEREAKSLAALHHPHIVTLSDFGHTESAELFMAMEYLPGQSLRDRLVERGPLRAGDALAIARDICGALDAAHRQGIVHRDLMPDNVMLADLSHGGGPRDVVKVLDFGIARLQGGDEGPNLTGTGHIVGTPGYIAPEMVTSGILDDPRRVGVRALDGPLTLPGADARHAADEARTRDAAAPR
jgi:serine/threonine-protein kinase